jgi:hypothetical protein
VLVAEEGNSTIERVCALAHAHAAAAAAAAGAGTHSAELRQFAAPHTHLNMVPRLAAASSSSNVE